MAGTRHRQTVSAASARERASLRGSRPRGGERGAALPSFSPLYLQIKALLLRSLQVGEWQPGQLIPSEQELARRFEVSQGTVRKAIEELALANLLVRRQGRGTFVASHAEEGTRYRFLRLTPDGGGVLPRLSRRFLDCRRLRATPEVARALELAAGETVIELRRLLLEGERPIVLDDLWLPAARFARLDAALLARWQGPLYRLFELEFSLRMIRAEERIRAVAAAPAEAALLGVAPASPLLLVERRSFTYGDQPVELRRGLYLTDRHHYRNEVG
ncbi:MAG: transcriptional regulator [Pseudomonadota bacterium]|nr:GntR family transcriptional regulator [Rubrivivax sp.]NLZ42648.1 GntR family transcriptional regulator [Comamonadaceae bacterium]